MLFLFYKRGGGRKLEKIINNKKIIEKGIKDQLESVTSTLQMIQQSEECPNEISKILFNQIGMLVFSVEELDSYFKLFNNFKINVS